MRLQGASQGPSQVADQHGISGAPSQSGSSIQLHDSRSFQLSQRSCHDVRVVLQSSKLANQILTSDMETTSSESCTRICSAQTSFVCVNISQSTSEEGSRTRPHSGGMAIRTYNEVFRRHEFIHRDLKPQNFLIARDGRIVLADFGFAKQLEDIQQMQRSCVMQESQSSTLVGTLNYISPEQFKYGMYGKFVDYWALGCILFEMLTGQVAFQFDDCEQFVSMMQNTDWANIKPVQTEEFEGLSEAAKDLIGGLLCEPQKRYGRSRNLKPLLEHRFFTLGVPTADILRLNNEYLQRAINEPESMTDADFDMMPLLPYEYLLLKLPNPWQPSVSPADQSESLATAADDVPEATGRPGAPAREGSGPGALAAAEARAGKKPAPVRLGSFVAQVADVPPLSPGDRSRAENSSFEKVLISSIVDDTQLFQQEHAFLFEKNAGATGRRYSTTD